MKPLPECLDLIQGKTVEEFTREHPHAVLIGLGVIGGEMQRNPAQAAGTMFLSLSGAPDSGDNGPLVNQVFSIRKLSHEVPEDGVYIGAGTENDIAIPDGSISKSHAHLLPVPEGWALVDHGSTNGSFINGSRIVGGVPTPLKGGDIVTVGRFSFTYYDALSFAKLLFVQAMARGRTRNRPRTPGVPARPAAPGAKPSGGSVGTPPGGIPAAQAPWSRGVDPDAGPPVRQTGTQEWQERAVGKIPLQSQPVPVGAQGSPAGTPPRPQAPPQGNGPGDVSATAAGRAQSARAPAEFAGTPTNTMPVPQTGWFRRLMLKIAQFFQRMAGG